VLTKCKASAFALVEVLRVNRVIVIAALNGLAATSLDVTSRTPRNCDGYSKDTNVAGMTDAHRRRLLQGMAASLDVLSYMTASGYNPEQNPYWSRVTLRY
jgi:hypothetical protein